MNKPWYTALAHCHDTGQPYVLVTVLGAAGSTPREPGAKMVVTSDASFDTIGGGQLEYLVVQAARESIANNKIGIEMQAFPLAAQAQQCCGGHVSVMLESFAPATWNVAVFGAGHVAQQLMPILARMPMRLQWLDNRPEYIESLGAEPLKYDAEASKVELTTFSDAASAVQSLPRNCEVVVLTHDHSLDFELCKAALGRSDIDFVGCIGSQTKAQRFEHKLLKQGVSPQALQNWVCPIGLPEVQGKLPIEVAVSISAQLVARKQLHSQHHHDRRGLAWRDLKSVLKLESERINSKSSTSPKGDTSHNKEEQP